MCRTISQTGEASHVIPVHRARPKKKIYSPGQVLRSATALKLGKSALLLGGEALSEAGILLAGRIAAATGADLLCDTFFARTERGGELPNSTRLPYFADQALELTRRYHHVVVAGTRRPVAFFGYPGLPSYLTQEEQTVMLAGPLEDALGALTALAAELRATDLMALVPGAPPATPTGALNAQSVCAVIARLQPADCHRDGRGVDRR